MKNMIKRIMIILVFTLIYPKYFTQNFKDTIAYDSMESYNWSGNWWVSTNNTGFASNVNVSPPASAYFYGSGNNNSAAEENWYVLPSIDTLRFDQEHKVQFRVASPRITSTSSTSGIDATDYIDIQVSTDGGVTYNSEIQITGNNNAYWNYNNATVSKVIDGSVDVYSPSSGGDRTLLGDGYSIVELIIPLGITQLAIDIYVRSNSNGEEFWFDDFFLLGSGGGTALPITLTSFEACQFHDDVRIDFIVESQVNNDVFEIQRSANGYEYSTIDSIPGDGTINQTMIYQYLDRYPIPGLSYYRLKQIDYDGVSELYMPVCIEYIPKRTVTLTIIPNPAISEIQVQVAEQDGTYFNHDVRIYDDHGNMVFKKFYFGDNSEFNINISKLSQGSYIVKSSTNEVEGIGKFIKK